MPYPFKSDSPLLLAAKEYKTALENWQKAHDAYLGWQRYTDTPRHLLSQEAERLRKIREAKKNLFAVAVVNNVQELLDVIVND